MTLHPPPGDNMLLAALPPREREQLAPELEPVDLPFRFSLQEAEQPIHHVWFPSAGVASSISSMEDGSTVELATTGREGFVGVAAAMASQQGPHSTFMQVAGNGYRLPIATFRRMVEVLPSFQPLLLRFALAFMTQIAQGAACNRLHTIDSRCARWLLMTHDRVDGDSFPLTHEFLGQMLGATRPSVSLAAAMLQNTGYIRYARGVIEVLDRSGLESVSCECYGVITREFRRLLTS